ncbi:hypothetical protein BD770DRAFT_477055 [Pilaira anomala]|nr:hypothetical protein BD770DRAFT_477055 [Pilaira anomala]
MNFGVDSLLKYQLYIPTYTHTHTRTHTHTHTKKKNKNGLNSVLWITFLFRLSLSCIYLYHMLS